MDIENYAPRTGRMAKEDSTVINEADLLYGIEIIFHNAATVAGDGTEFTVGGYKTLTIEISGTSATRTVAFIGKGPSGTARTIMGVKLSDLTTGTSTTGTGELWQFDITGLTGVLMDLTAVAGGNVTVAGRAVA